MFIIKTIYRFLIDTVQTLLLAASVFLVIYVFLFRPFEVNGQSMYPNFHNGELILTNLISLKTGNPRRGDVIVLQAPDEPEKDYIKRVIGMPGDTLYINNGDIFINNKKFDESAYLKNSVKTFGGAFLMENQPVTVPMGEYFVMGDNRANSKDSRALGFIAKDKLIGLSFFVYWPPDRMRLLKNPF